MSNGYCAGLVQQDGILNMERPGRLGEPPHTLIDTHLHSATFQRMFTEVVMINPTLYIYCACCLFYLAIGVGSC